MELRDKYVVVFLGLVGEGGSDADGWLLFVVAVVVGFGSPGEDGEVIWFADEIFDHVCPCCQKIDVGGVGKVLYKGE